MEFKTLFSVMTSISMAHPSWFCCSSQENWQGLAGESKFPFTFDWEEYPCHGGSIFYLSSERDAWYSRRGEGWWGHSFDRGVIIYRLARTTSAKKTVKKCLTEVGLIIIRRLCYFLYALWPPFLLLQFSMTWVQTLAKGNNGHSLAHRILSLDSPCSLKKLINLTMGELLGHCSSGEKICMLQHRLPILRIMP